MSDAKETLAATRPGSRAKTEKEVRGEMLNLASVMIGKAQTAATAVDARDFTEAAAVALDAASVRSTDVPPDGGRIGRAPTDVPPDGG